MLGCILWDVLVSYGKGMSYNIKFDVVCIPLCWYILFSCLHSGWLMTMYDFKFKFDLLIIDCSMKNQEQLSWSRSQLVFGRIFRLGSTLFSKKISPRWEWLWQLWSCPVFTVSVWQTFYFKVAPAMDSE